MVGAHGPPPACGPKPFALRPKAAFWRRVGERRPDGFGPQGGHAPLPHLGDAQEVNAVWTLPCIALAFREVVARYRRIGASARGLAWGFI
jgi:hypothetical protein